MIPVTLSFNSDDTVLLIGGGAVGERRIEPFLSEPCTSVVISPVVTERIAQWATEGRLIWLSRLGTTDDIERYSPALLLLCTDDVETNERLQGLARQKRIWTNRSDDAMTSQVAFPSTVTIGELRIAISANGVGPFLNRLIRLDLDSRYAPLVEAMDDIRAMRREVKRKIPHTKERQLFWRTHFTEETLQSILQGNWSSEKEILNYAISSLGAQS